MSNQLADFQTFLLFVTHLVEVITKGLFADAKNMILSIETFWKVIGL